MADGMWFCMSEKWGEQPEWQVWAEAKGVYHALRWVLGHHANDGVARDFLVVGNSTTVMIALTRTWVASKGNLQFKRIIAKTQELMDTMCINLYTAWVPGSSAHPADCISRDPLGFQGPFSHPPTHIPSSLIPLGICFSKWKPTASTE